MQSPLAAAWQSLSQKHPAESELDTLCRWWFRCPVHRVWTSVAVNATMNFNIYVHQHQCSKWLASDLRLVLWWHVNKVRMLYEQKHQYWEQDLNAFLKAASSKEGSLHTWQTNLALKHFPATSSGSFYSNAHRAWFRIQAASFRSAPRCVKSFSNTLTPKWSIRNSVRDKGQN